MEASPQALVKLNHHPHQTSSAVLGSSGLFSKCSLLPVDMLNYRSELGLCPLEIVYRLNSSDDALGISIRSQYHSSSPDNLKELSRQVIGKCPLLANHR